MTGVESPFLDRLAVTDGVWTPQEIQAVHAHHAGQHSRHSDAQTQEASQLAAGSACPGPDQATDVALEPNQATGSDFKPDQATEVSAQEAQGNHLSAGDCNSEEEGHANHHNSAADPMAEGQTLASNLAFQQELQQRSSERHARAGASSRDTSNSQQMAEGGVPRGQEGGQRNQRYHTELPLTQ